MVLWLFLPLLWVEDFLVNLVANLRPTPWGFRCITSLTLIPGTLLWKSTHYFAARL